MKARNCRHCGDWVPHDAPSAICGRCACLPVAERGRGFSRLAHAPRAQPLPTIRPDATTDCRPLPGDPDRLRPIRLMMLQRSFGPLAFAQAR